MLDVILETLLDTAKLLPFLYLTYLFMEYLEHRSGSVTERWLRKSGRVGPLVGGLLGAVPQCGFSSAASGLYAGRIITTGTLIAVYLSTSDEMLPILISEKAPIPTVLTVLACKIVIGMIAGLAIDRISALIGKRKLDRETAHESIEELCERENCQCSDHFALSALKHTLHITGFILLIAFALNTAVHFVGEERIASIVLDRPVLGNLLAALVGLIPNCASSVILTKLYLESVISAGAMMSGLLVNSGIALTILFRNNRPVRDSLRILLFLFVIGLSCGILIDLTGFLPL